VGLFHSQRGFIPIMSRINIWIVIAILLVLFAVTRYLDARKTDAAYLCQRPFRPGVPTLSFR